ncbi:transposase [Acetobacterium tundrae]|uniref:HTH-like domain-containing protein n=1 Tax=Acetobacterium tundrae TaxID=132932 RepID=A0ABR6WNZ1_9FIRM|nr:hypothetical protein [Acetobacterium tundrae]
MKLSRSTAYHEPVGVAPSKDEINIKNTIDLIHFEEPSYGVRRIRNELYKLGFHPVGRRLVRRYMVPLKSSTAIRVRNLLQMPILI